jgi:ABC-type branched-subunit amino acid transport system substrate-binding protein
VAVLAGGIGEALASQPGVLALVNATDHDSRQTAQALLRALGERDLTPARQLEFTPGGDTFEAQLRALEALDPTVLVLLAGAEDSARFLQGLQRRKLQPVIFGAPDMGRRVFGERAGAAVEGVRFPCLLAVAPEHLAELRRFQADFQSLVGHPADYAALQTYDAARLLIAAIRRAGPDRRAVRAALFELSPWSGLAGEIRFDGLGRNLRSVARLARIHDGRVIPLGAVEKAIPSFGPGASSSASQDGAGCWAHQAKAP